MDDKVNYWIELSDYDFETALAMLESKRFLYVGFMCHQTIEKIFKAFYVSKNPENTLPYIHNLTLLSKKGGFYDLLAEEQKDFLDVLEPLNIEARYPSPKERLIKSLTESRCEEIINKTKEMQEWVKRKL